jgi:hypothetical protein
VTSPLFSQVMRDLAAQSQTSQLVVDTLSSDFFFVGKAELGVKPFSPQWQVARMSRLDQGKMLEEYPGGSSGFTFTWEHRRVYTYGPLTQENVP